MREKPALVSMNLLKKRDKSQNLLDDLSNSSLAVRLYGEGRATGPPADHHTLEDRYVILSRFKACSPIAVARSCAVDYCRFDTGSGYRRQRRPLQRDTRGVAASARESGRRPPALRETERSGSRQFKHDILRP